MQLDISDNNDNDDPFQSKTLESDLSIENTGIAEVDLSFEKTPLWLGNCVALFYYRENPLIVIGPDWKYYLGTNIFTITLSFVFLRYIISSITYIGTIIGFIVLLIQVFSYMMTALMNPGIPDRNLTKNKNAKELYPKYKPYNEVAQFIARNANWRIYLRRFHFIVLVVIYA